MSEEYKEWCTHEFDSSRTCNYCGVAAEQCKGIAENEFCCVRYNTIGGEKGNPGTRRDAYEEAMD